MAGLTVVTTDNQELMTGWSGMQDFDAPYAGTTSSEGDGLRGPSLGVDCEVLSDWGAHELVDCFSEGRRLLLGV